MSMIGNFLAISSNKAIELKNEPNKIEDFLYSDEIQESENLLDVDKAWHGVHYLLTNSAWEGEEPLKSVVFGGEEVGDDVGYGPARILSSETVKIVNDALLNIEPSKLKEKFNASTLNDAEIYPEGWSNEDADYIIGAFEEIKSFYNKAASNQQCVIQFLN